VPLRPQCRCTFAAPASEDRKEGHGDDREIASVDGPYDVTTATFGDDPTEVIVVTDANLLFGTAVDLVRLMRIPALVPPRLTMSTRASAAQCSGCLTRPPPTNRGSRM
jgi:hypothetical protein